MHLVKACSMVCFYFAGGGYPYYKNVLAVKKILKICSLTTDILICAAVTVIHLNSLSEMY